jgi:hypothetical protein
MKKKDANGSVEPESGADGESEVVPEVKENGHSNKMDEEIDPQDKGDGHAEGGL